MQNKVIPAFQRQLSLNTKLYQGLVSAIDVSPTFPNYSHLRTTFPLKHPYHPSFSTGSIQSPGLHHIDLCQTLQTGAFPIVRILLRSMKRTMYKFKYVYIYMSHTYIYIHTTLYIYIYTICALLCAHILYHSTKSIET